MNIKYASDTKRPAVIKTVLHTYRIDTSTPTGAQEWKELHAERKAQGVKLFDYISTSNKRTDAPDGKAFKVQLETGHIFNNQWNTNNKSDAPFTDFRVFEWSQEICPNRDIKIGHYLEMTDEMTSIKNNTFKCGYCGKTYHGAHNANTFCSACLDSEYLKVDNLPLLRVMPCAWDGNRPNLTAQESKELTALYTERQVMGTSSRAVAKREKIRAEIAKEYKETKEKGSHKFHGFTWLLDNNINTDNCIYYEHKDEFCFGWRTPLSKDVAAKLETALIKFPYHFTLKYA